MTRAEAQAAKDGLQAEYRACQDRVAALSEEATRLKTEIVATAGHAREIRHKLRIAEADLRAAIAAEDAEKAKQAVE